MMESNFNKNGSNLSYQCIVCKNNFSVYISSNDLPYQTSLCESCRNKVQNINTDDMIKVVRVGNILDIHTHDLVDIVKWYKQMINM